MSSLLRYSGRGAALLEALGSDALLLIGGWHPLCPRRDPWSLDVHLVRHLLLRGATGEEVEALLRHPGVGAGVAVGRDGIEGILTAARACSQPVPVRLLKATKTRGSTGGIALTLRLSDGSTCSQLVQARYRIAVLSTFGAIVETDALPSDDATVNRLRSLAGRQGLVRLDPTKTRNPVVEWFPMPGTGGMPSYIPPPWWHRPLGHALREIEGRGLHVDIDQFTELSILYAPVGDSKDAKAQRSAMEAVPRAAATSLDGRVRCRLYCASAGRIIAVRPGLQSVPRGCRPAFKPAKGMAFVEVDINACHARLAARMAEDTELHAVFAEQAVGGPDIYEVLSSMASARATSARPEAIRDLGKALMLPLLNLAGADTLVPAAEACGWAIDVGTLKANFARRFSKTAAWQMDPRIPLHLAGSSEPSWQRTKPGRFVSPVLRRVSMPPDAYAHDSTILRSTSAPAAALQAAEGDILRLAIIHAQPRLKALGGSIVMPMHDGLLAEAPIGETTAAAEILLAAFQQAASWAPSLVLRDAVKTATWTGGWQAGRKLRPRPGR